MKAVKLFSFLLLIATAFASQSAETISNDIDQGEGRSEPIDYDPSFLDEILSPDYFDKSEEKTTEVAASNNDDGEPEVVTKRGPCMGCPMDVDEKNLNTEKLQDLANFAVETYASGNDGEKDNDESLRFIRIVKAQTQVVAGFKYFLEVEAGYYNCTKEQYESDRTQCVLNTGKPVVVCKFEVLEQAWAGRKEVMSSDCQETQSFVESSQDDEIPATTVGYSEAYEIDDDTSARKKRDTHEQQAVGKLRQADESDQVLKEMATFALEQLDTIDADNDARVLVDVLNVRKQTVSGWLYHMKLRVAETTCAEGKNATLEQCRDKVQLPFLICDVKILFQPWQTVQKKVTESQCFPEKMKASKKLAKKLFGDEFKKNKIHKLKKSLRGEKPIGGPKEVDPESPEIKSLMDWAVESLDAQSNALHAQKVVKVIHAERQLVSGVMNKLTFETGYTNCRKNSIKDRSVCQLDEAREHNFCEMHIWEKPWLHEKRVTYSKCGKREEILKRKKRSLIGGDDHDYRGHEVAKFEEFKSKFGKEYASHEEYKYRLGVFRDNMKKVKLLQENEQGTATYGATMFADLTEEEFSRHYLGLRPDLRQKSKVKKAKIPPFTKLPDEFDWRHYNAVTPVKNQGMCGSCWAFSVTGNIEGLYAKKHQNLLSFSEQELVDCDTLDQGCGGGLPENAYKAIQKLGGLETEQAYPYDGKNEKCHYKSDLAKAQVTGFVEVSKNETEMAAFLVKNGPISIGLNANAMQFYFGGVSHPWKFLCSPKQLDHGVLIVGYGVHTSTIRHKTLPYWLVKNSWGPHWGEQGYYRVYRGDGTCGLNQMATSAVIA